MVGWGSEGEREKSERAWRVVRVEKKDNLVLSLWLLNV